MELRVVISVYPEEPQNLLFSDEETDVRSGKGALEGGQ
jgi:hypothetical protein